MLHLILTHHVTAPSPPISPQTREDTKEIRVVCSLTLRSALAPAIGHRHTHPQSEARTPPGPGTVRRADSWHILPSPSTRSQKAPSLVFLTLPTCLASDLDEGNFSPLSRSSLTGIARRSSRAPTRSPLLQSPLRDSSPNSWHPAALQQLRTAPVGKQ